MVHQSSQDTSEPAIEVDSDPAEGEDLNALDNSNEREEQRSNVTSHASEKESRHATYVAHDDSPKTDQKDAKHEYFKLVMDGRLHLAPIGNNPERILDLGTGTGCWCVDMGEQYPHARIIGTDLSKVSPSRVAPNVTFEIENFEDEWTVPENSCDLAHHRFNLTTVSDWPSQFSKAFKVLRRGAFIEVVDIRGLPETDDDTIPENSQLVRFFDHIRDGYVHIGKDPKVVSRWRMQLEEAGYINVQERVLKVPIGVWPEDRRLKEAGMFKLETMRELLRTLAHGFFTRVLRWKTSEVDIFFALVRNELEDTSIHWWLPMHVVWAQKPLT